MKASLRYEYPGPEIPDTARVGDKFSFTATATVVQQTTQVDRDGLAVTDADLELTHIQIGKPAP